MHTTCKIVDLNGTNPTQCFDLEGKTTSDIYEWIDSLPYGSLIIFSTTEAPSKMIIMCPGGGLLKINFQHEGFDFMNWFLKQHVSYAILKYHLPADNRFSTINDASLAVQSIRNLYPHIEKVGIMGASIGGYIAAHAAIFGIDNNRVDFQILMYPVINMQNTWTHALSRERLFGKELSETEQVESSLEYQIGQSTPMAFIVAATDDPVVSPINSIRFCEYLISNKIPVSFHLYPIGGHSFGFNDFLYKKEWLGELSYWLNSI